MVRLSLAMLDTLAYNGILLFSLLLTVNRLCIFMLPSLDALFFQQPQILM